MGGAGLGENTVVLAYVTEGIFGIPGMMDALAKALARPDDLTVVWIAETDMRHGWSEFMAANPSNSGWQDAVSHSCRLIPAKYYEKGRASWHVRLGDSILQGQGLPRRATAVHY